MNEQTSNPYLAHREDAPELVEHTDHGAEEFDRHEGASFSDEDRGTLRHVASVLALLVVIALTLIAVAIYDA
jgi:hypothetical protein